MPDLSTPDSSISSHVEFSSLGAFLVQARTWVTFWNRDMGDSSLRLGDLAVLLSGMIALVGSNTFRLES